MNRMDIVACTDKWFVMPTGVMMQSVCVNNADVDIVFHIIVDDTVSTGDRHDLEDVVSAFDGKTVMFYAANKEMLNRLFPAGQYRYDITKATYYRLYIAELLPKNIEKVLYLDGDVIVRHSLLPLWNTDLNGYPIAAVPIDYMKATHDFYSRVGESPQLGYFNAGVLLINVAVWRERRIVKTFLSGGHAEDIRYHDQDVLNFAFMREKVFLPIKYNMQTGFYFKKPLYDPKYGEEVRASFMDPVIIHFTGVSPWERYNRYPHPLRSTFLKYQNMTKWRNVKYDRRPFKLRMVHLRADLLRKWNLRPPITNCFIDIAPID